MVLQRLCNLNTQKKLHNPLWKSRSLAFIRIAKFLKFIVFDIIKPDYCSLSLFYLQYLVAVFIFVYMYQNKKMRLYYAPFHDIIGIWLFLCYVGTYLTGVYFLYESHIGFLPGSEVSTGWRYFFLFIYLIYLIGFPETHCFDFFSIPTLPKQNRNY